MDLKSARLEELLKDVPLKGGSQMRGVDGVIYILFDKGTSWVVVEAVKEAIQARVKGVTNVFVDSGQMEMHHLKYITVTHL